MMLPICQEFVRLYEMRTSVTQGSRRALADAVSDRHIACTPVKLLPATCGQRVRKRPAAPLLVRCRAPFGVRSVWRPSVEKVRTCHGSPSSEPGQTHRRGNGTTGRFDDVMKCVLDKGDL